MENEKTLKKKAKRTYNYKKENTIDKQDRIDMCLCCTKPMRECKGDCFGRNN